MKPRRFVRRVLTFLGVCLATMFLSGCHSWHVQNMELRRVVTEQRPDRIRVTLVDSSSVELNQPAISGDTLFGEAAVDPHELRGVPLTRVIQVETQESDVGATILTVFGAMLMLGVGLVYLLALALASSS